MADKRDILIRLLGEETVARMADRAGDGLDRFGKTLDATENDAKDLDRQIAEVEGSLKTLAVAFARTSDAADKVDITKAMRRQQTELSRLTKARNLLPDFTEQGSKSALGFAAGFAKAAPTAIRGAMAGGPGAVIGGAVAAFLVPTLSAAVAGAVVGGIGLGGVIGGVALASKDARVQAAGRDLSDAVMGDLEKSGTRFVQPTIQGIGIIRSAWDDVSDDVDGVLAATSRYVVPLARGIADAARELAPEFRKAAEAAEPIVREISEGIPRVARALGDVMSDFSDDADEGASAIRYLFMVVEEGTRFVGGAVHAFAQMYGAVLDIADGAVVVQEALLGWNPLFKGQIQENRQKVDELKGALDRGGDAGAQAGTEIAGGLLKAGNAADTSADKVETWADIVRESTDRAIASEHASIRLEQAFLDAAEAAKENSKAGIKNTEAGVRNRQALLGIAEAAKASAADVFKNTQSHELASAVTEKARVRFLATAKAMGVEKGEAIALANRLFGIPKEVNTKSKFYPDNAGVRAWKRTLSGIDRKIFIKAHFDLIENRDVGMALRLGRLSTGGPVTGPGPKGVDSQPYLLAPGEYVLNARDVDAAGGVAGVERLRDMIRGGGGRVPAMAGTGGGGRGGGGGGATIIHNTFNLNLPATANAAEQGRQVVNVIKAYERGSGSGWRQ